MRVTSKPFVARTQAVARPAGPPPATTASVAMERRGVVVRVDCGSGGFETKLDAKMNGIADMRDGDLARSRSLSYLGLDSSSHAIHTLLHGNNLPQDQDQRGFMHDNAIVDTILWRGQLEGAVHPSPGVKKTSR